MNTNIFKRKKDKFILKIKNRKKKKSINKKLNLAIYIIKHIFKCIYLLKPVIQVILDDRDLL